MVLPLKLVPFVWSTGACAVREHEAGRGTYVTAKRPGVADSNDTHFGGRSSCDSGEGSRGPTNRGLTSSLWAGVTRGGIRAADGGGLAGSAGAEGHARGPGSDPAPHVPAHNLI